MILKGSRSSASLPFTFKFFRYRIITMAIFLTQFNVTLNDGTKKIFASEDIEAETLEEAEEIAKEMSPTLYVAGELIEDVMPWRIIG